jgi:hypothetical protein
MTNNIALQQMRSNLRQVFQDKYAVQWSDVLLDEIIYEAMREYAFYSRRLIAETDLILEDSTLIRCPEDFIEVKQVIGVDGREIPVVSYRRLATVYGDFRRRTGGCVQCICFDFDDHGILRVFPEVPAGSFIGKMFYARFPLEMDWNIDNLEAIEAYALFVMFSWCGKAQAENYFNKFIDLVNEEKIKPVLSGNSRTIHSGRFF